MEQVYGFRGFTISTPTIQTKEQAIRAIIAHLVETGELLSEDAEGVTRSVLSRERLGSTGIGRGCAIPHGLYHGVRRLIATVANFPQGIDFDSVDDQPVYVVCLIVVPTDRPGDHMKLLEAAAKHFRERPR